MLHTKIKDTKKEKIHISNAEKFIKGTEKESKKKESQKK